MCGAATATPVSGLDNLLGHDLIHALNPLGCVSRYVNGGLHIFSVHRRHVYFVSLEVQTLSHSTVKLLRQFAPVFVNLWLHLHTGTLLNEVFYLDLVHGLQVLLREPLLLSQFPCKPFQLLLRMPQPVFRDGLCRLRLLHLYVSVFFEVSLDVTHLDFQGVPQRPFGHLELPVSRHPLRNVALPI